MADFTKNLLYEAYRRIDSEFKPKVKEIISMATKNMIDLSRCVILIHSAITDPNVSNKELATLLRANLGNWHVELISTCLENRRNTSRLVSDLKYVIGGLDDAESLFARVNKISGEIRENWTSKLNQKTAEDLRNTLIDFSLIVNNEESEKSFINSKIDNLLMNKYKPEKPFQSSLETKTYDLNKLINKLIPERNSPLVTRTPNRLITPSKILIN